MGDGGPLTWPFASQVVSKSAATGPCDGAPNTPTEETSVPESGTTAEVLTLAPSAADPLPAAVVPVVVAQPGTVTAAKPVAKPVAKPAVKPVSNPAAAAVAAVPAAANVPAAVNAGGRDRRSVAAESASVDRAALGAGSQG